MKKKEKADWRPHCDICGHNHVGPCTQCDECNRGKLSEESEPVKLTPVAIDEDTPLTAIEELAYHLAMAEVRISTLEDLVAELIEARRQRTEYMKKYMRKRRAED